VEKQEFEMPDLIYSEEHSVADVSAAERYFGASGLSCRVCESLRAASSDDHRELSMIAGEAVFADTLLASDDGAAAAPFGLAAAPVLFGRGDGVR
jgi:hypothetical protein